MEIDKMSATESAAKAPAKAATEDSAEAGANASNASAEAPGEAVRGTMQRASDQENPPATRRLVTLRYERDGETVEHLVIVDNGIFNTHINRTCVSKFLVHHAFSNVISTSRVYANQMLFFLVVPNPSCNFLLYLPVCPWQHRCRRFPVSHRRILRRCRKVELVGSWLCLGLLCNHQCVVSI